MKNRKAFTLIEILIAVTIFSFAMIIASGIFSNIVGNQSLVNVSSDVNREGQRILRQISDDTINATETGTVSSDANLKPRGILFLNDQNAIVTPSANCTALGAAGCDFAGVVLFTKSGIKVYRYVDVSGIKTLEYGINTANPRSNQLQMIAGTPPRLGPRYIFSQLNSNDVELVSNGFSGASCYNSSCTQSPFIRINLTAQTKDYANKAARHRAKIDLRTMITGRSY